MILGFKTSAKLEFILFLNRSFNEAFLSAKGHGIHMHFWNQEMNEQTTFRKVYMHNKKT